MSVLESAVQVSNMKMFAVEGESPDQPGQGRSRTGTFQKSRVAWECCLKKGDKHHLRLNTGGRPIVNKYREGKFKSTLKRE